VFGNKAGGGLLPELAMPDIAAILGKADNKFVAKFQEIDRKGSHQTLSGRP
jgi:hypothetical protein